MNNRDHDDAESTDCISLSTERIIEGEIWTKVSYLPPNLEVSNMGRIRKFINLTDYEIVKLKLNNGYLHFNHAGESYLVHRVVAEGFLSDSKHEKKSIVNHKNGLNCDNRVENLEWISPQENLMKNYNSGSDSRKKIYCKDLDQVYGTLRSASYILNIPQDILSDSIKQGYPVFGHSLVYIDSDDNLLVDRNILYVDYETAVSLIKSSSDLDEFNEKLSKFLESGGDKAVK